MQEGKPILELPPKNIDLVTLTFSAEERDVRFSSPFATLNFYLCMPVGIQFFRGKEQDSVEQVHQRADFVEKVRITPTFVLS